MLDGWEVHLDVESPTFCNNDWSSKDEKELDQLSKETQLWELVFMYYKPTSRYSRQSIWNLCDHFEHLYLSGIWQVSCSSTKDNLYVGASDRFKY